MSWRDRPIPDNVDDLVAALRARIADVALAPAASVAAGVIMAVLLMLADAIEITLGQSALIGWLVSMTASGVYAGGQALAKG